jgi:hypothetical protein
MNRWVANDWIKAGDRDVNGYINVLRRRVKGEWWAVHYQLGHVEKRKKYKWKDPWTMTEWSNWVADGIAGSAWKMAEKEETEWVAQVDKWQMERGGADRRELLGGVTKEVAKPVRARTVPLMPAWKLRTSMQWVLRWEDLEGGNRPNRDVGGLDSAQVGACFFFPFPRGAPPPPTHPPTHPPLTPHSARAKAKASRPKCVHGRQKAQCKDCGTGYCEHKRRKFQCKDCGTAKRGKECKHGRTPSRCKDCGTGHCVHERNTGLCRDCGTGHCEHGRDKRRSKDCGTGHCEHGRRKDLAYTSTANRNIHFFEIVF